MNSVISVLKNALKTHVFLPSSSMLWKKWSASFELKLLENFFFDLSQGRNYYVLFRMKLLQLTSKTGIGHALSENCYIKITQRKPTMLTGNLYVRVLWTMWRLANQWDNLHLRNAHMLRYQNELAGGKFIEDNYWQ